MNNACPSCGAVYLIAAKDIGRKIKCKKCGAALAVSDAGLVVDTPTGSAPPAVFAAPAAAVAANDDFDAGGEVVSKSKKLKKYSGGAGDHLTTVGGIPTILFGLGVFLVIWFTFMTPIGEAATARASVAALKLQNEQAAELKKLLPKGKKSSAELTEEERKKYDEEAKKIAEKYEKLIETANEDAASIEISNVRSVWFDKYGQMFGFLFVAFGCIGYLRTEQPLVMRIVAAVILTFMMMVVFSTIGSGCGTGGPKLPVPKGRM